MASKNKVIFDIIANTKEYSDGLKKIDKQTELVTRSMKIGFAATAAAITGSLVAFASYETALKKVGKTANLEGQALNDFGKKVTEMSERIPLSTTSLLELSAAAAQLGVKGEKNILAFTETMAKLESATDIAGEEGARSISRFLKITGDGNENVARFGATITQLGNQVAATEAEILSVSTRVGQDTAQFELGATNVLAISAALKELGFQAERSGTSMSKTFKAIQSAVFEGGQSLETLMRITGQTRKELKETFEKDATKSFQTFIDALAKLPANEVIQALNEMGLSGSQVSGVLGTLASRSDVLASALQIAREEAEKQTALDKEFAAAVDTLANTFELFKNEVKNLATSIGQDLAPEVKVLLQDITSFLRILRNLNEETGGLISGSVKAAAKITLLYLAFQKLERMMGLTGKTSIFLSRALFRMTGGSIKGASALKTLKLSLIGLNTTLKTTKVTLGGFVAGIWLAVEAGRALGKFIGKFGELKTAEQLLAKSTKELNELQKERIKLQAKADGGSKRAQRKLEELDEEIAKEESLNNVYQKQVDTRKKLKEDKGTGESEGTATEQVEEASVVAPDNLKSVEDEKTAIQTKGIEDRLTNAEREAELLKQIQDGATDEQIKAIQERNAQLSQIDAKQTELEGINAELKKQGLMEAEQEKLELQQQTAEQELVNLQTNFEIQEEERRLQEEIQAERKAELREIAKELKITETEEDLELLNAKLLSEQEVEDQYRRQRLQKGIEEKNQGLKNEVQYGKAFGKVKTFFDSEQVKGTQQTLNTIGQIKTKEGSTAFKIQKGFATAEATISTAKAAIDAYSSLAGIPIIGPALGIAAAAAATAYGIQQVSAIQGQNLAFATGTDNVPQNMTAQIHQNEGIIPAKENQFLQSGKTALIGTDFLENSGLNNEQVDSGLTVNVSFDGASILGNLDEDMSLQIADDIANAIDENRFAGFPQQ